MDYLKVKIMNEKKYRVCIRCVMDTSDPKIYFDEKGVCNHCNTFDATVKGHWFPNEEGKGKLKNIFEDVKKQGENQEYDCIIGLSGGVDSSYLALLMKDYGLRPLVVHVDAGWNSELAVYNIEKIVKYCNYELHTVVLDWQEVRDLQLAYLKAGIANQDVVQDHAFFASLYHFSVKNKIKYVISGGNIATEFVFPQSWHHSAMDAINLKSIHKKYGSVKLRNYKTISFFQYYIYYPFIKKMKTIRPLNYLPYDRKKALSELKTTVGYKEYGRKHGESRFTKFFQNYYLPKKFGYDKRRAHLSSLILSGLITRNEAMSELDLPLYEYTELQQDKQYIAKKLGITVDELDSQISFPGRSYKDFNNWDPLYKSLKKIQETMSFMIGRDITHYG